MISRKVKVIIGATIASIATTLALLSGCGSAPATEDPDAKAGYMMAYPVPLPNGKTVFCVSYQNRSNLSPLSCDWEHAA